MTLVGSQEGKTDAHAELVLHRSLSPYQRLSNRRDALLNTSSSPPNAKEFCGSGLGCCVNTGGLTSVACTHLWNKFPDMEALEKRPFGGTVVLESDSVSRFKA